jgi:hypothetical protein
MSWIILWLVLSVPIPAAVWLFGTRLARLDATKSNLIEVSKAKYGAPVSNPLPIKLPGNQRDWIR